MTADFQDETDVPGPGPDPVRRMKGSIRLILFIRCHIHGPASPKSFIISRNRNPACRKSRGLLLFFRFEAPFQMRKQHPEK